MGGFVWFSNLISLIKQTQKQIDIQKYFSFVLQGLFFKLS